MRNNFVRAVWPLAAALLTSLAAPVSAEAEQVQIKPSLLRLNANLELPTGKTVADGVLILVHGTLSHARQETMAALQKNLKERGIATLAITLSLGVDNREGPRSCDVLHDYALAGAQREINLWVTWLAAHGTTRIDLLGFSLGGAQVAAMAPELIKVRRVVLMAPAFVTSVEQAASYEHAFGHPLAPELAAAKKDPLQNRTVDFMLCKQAPVLGASFLDAYTELPPKLAARTGHPTLVVVAGNDERVPDLVKRLPSDVHPVVIAGASHFFPDLYGEEAADAIAKFLKQPRSAIQQ
jgi:pimeloyl-ACP methyl ester carboxylesterase